MSTARMTDSQAAVAEKALTEEDRHRRHLVVHLSGAHAYGFPSPDSDLDLKAMHILPTRELVGLDKASLVSNRLEIVDGVEVDYTSNELQTCLSGVLSGDGNMLERVLSRFPLRADPLLTELQPLARACISKRYHHHYRGFARSQAKRALEAEAPSAKKVLYVLRTALTGTHLLLERDCQPDLTALWERYGFPEVPELVELKQAGERSTLKQAWAKRVEPLMDRVLKTLDGALERSTLSEEAGGEEALVEWMLDARRRYW